MNMSSVSKDGITINVLSLVENKEYPCGDCWSKNDCSIKKNNSIKPLKTKLVATEVMISVTNATNEAFSIRTGAWELVDSEGYANGATSICDNHMVARTVNPDSWTVSPGTKVKFILLFPEMESGINAISLIYGGTPYMRLNIREIPSE